MANEERAQDRRRRVRAEQVRLLYANAAMGSAANVLVACILSYLQWAVVPHRIILMWLTYMVAVAALRFVMTRGYWASPDRSASKWGNLFTAGSALGGAGWAAAPFLLYPPDLNHQILLAFVVGGMMLGAVSLLSARPETFMAYALPPGAAVCTSFLLHGGQIQIGVSLLALVFTVDLAITSWNIYRTVTLSLLLRFKNAELLENLRRAHAATEAFNQQLEFRVGERTAELHDANERLRREMEQRKQAEEDLLQARKLESLGVLAGGIAHDFNNFLTVVQGSVEVARMHAGTSDLVHEQLDQIVKACQRAAALASQLLTFGKGGAPVRRAASAKRLIDDSIALVRAGANVSIHLSVPDDLWSADIDVQQTGHALHNILLNARQAMPAGGVIEVRASNFVAEQGSLLLKPGRYVQISVRDYGCGIPTDVLPRIFDPYFTTKSGGSGLGLATAYAVIAKHQGHISVDSREGEGTRFTIYLPAAEEKPAAAEPGVGAALSRGSGRVLAMDDDEPLLALLAKLLKAAGYEVACARDGAEAIAKFEEANGAGRGFDAVLLDLTVPGGMGGEDAAAALRQIDPSVPLIVSSGYSEAPVLAEFRSYGFDAALRKPWTAADLTRTLKQAIEARRRPPDRSNHIAPLNRRRNA